MAPEFLKLTPEEQRDVINAASSGIGLLPAVVEKDVWVCWVLDVLFSTPGRRPMVFKGGTSLSKVFNLIKRFSEDIDISINFLQDYEAPISKTKASNIREEIEAKLQTYKDSVIVPAIAESAKSFGLTVEPGDSRWELHVNYNSVLASGIDYIKTRVKIELSGRNETEPSQTNVVRPYLVTETSELAFPEATIDALVAERTFWEKVTLIHAGLNSRTIEETPERMSRYWSDLTVIMKSPVGERAIENHQLCLQVVDHKDRFRRDGRAKYDDCRNKKFRLVPTGTALAVLRADYDAMVDAGMFFSTAPDTFEKMMAEIAALESILNS